MTDKIRNFDKSRKTIYSSAISILRKTWLFWVILEESPKTIFSDAIFKMAKTMLFYAKWLFACQNRQNWNQNLQKWLCAKNTKITIEKVCDLATFHWTRCLEMHRFDWTWWHKIVQYDWSKLDYSYGKKGFSSRPQQCKNGAKKVMARKIRCFGFGLPYWCR